MSIAIYSSAEYNPHVAAGKQHGFGRRRGGRAANSQIAGALRISTLGRANGDRATTSSSGSMDMQNASQA